MARVKVHSEAEAVAPASPSGELIRQATLEETITDAKGRRILMRKPGVLAQFHLVEAVGPEAAANQTYMQMINPLIYVGKINDEVVPVPATKLQVEGLISRLDDEGLSAVMGWYMANVIGPTMDAIKAAEQQERLKNL